MEVSTEKQIMNHAVTLYIGINDKEIEHLIEGRILQFHTTGEEPNIEIIISRKQDGGKNRIG